MKNKKIFYFIAIFIAIIAVSILLPNKANAATIKEDGEYDVIISSIYENIYTNGKSTYVVSFDFDEGEEEVLVEDLVKDLDVFAYGRKVLGWKKSFDNSEKPTNITKLSKSDFNYCESGGVKSDKGFLLNPILSMFLKRFINVESKIGIIPREAEIQADIHPFLELPTIPHPVIGQNLIEINIPEIGEHVGQSHPKGYATAPLDVLAQFHLAFHDVPVAITPFVIPPHAPEHSYLGHHRPWHIAIIKQGVEFHGHHSPFPHLPVCAISKVRVTERIAISQRSGVRHLFPTEIISAPGIQHEIARVIREIKPQAVIDDGFVLPLQQVRILETKTVHPFNVHHRPEKHRAENDPDGHRGRQSRRPFHPGVELSQDRPERKHGHAEEGQPGARRHEYLVCFVIHRRMFFVGYFPLLCKTPCPPYSLMLRRARYPAPINTASPPSIEGTISTFGMAIGCAWRTAACLIRARN